MKIYVVTEDRYGENEIVALCSSRDDAQVFLDKGKGNVVGEYELDPPDIDMLRRGYQVWGIVMGRDGTVFEAYDRYDSSDIRDEPEIEMVKRADHGSRLEMRYYLWARSKGEAVYLANEKRAQFIAEGKWPEEG